MQLLRSAFVVFITSVSYFPFAQGQFEVFEAGITDIQAALEAGEITSVELVEQYLQRITAYDQQGPNLNSIIRINPQAQEIARQLDGERQTSGPRSLLHGVPIVVKDNYNTDDMPTTGGSVALASFVPSENAAQVDKMIAAGAIVLAKTNLHEYAYGITSISSVLGQTRNPYDPRRVPGGSSGGTGAAVAASFGAIGFGSDTCGSIRIPSAFNNLIGLRPSKGLSSIFGVMPLSHTQDVAGPLARSAEDLAIVLDLTVGFDSRDEATQIMQAAPAPEFLAHLNAADLPNLRIGKLTAYFDRADAPVRQAINEALEWYEQQGVEIVEIDIAELGGLLSASGLISHEFRNDLNQYLSQFQSEEIQNLNDIVDLGLYHEAVQGVLTRSRYAEFDEQAYQTAVAGRQVLRDALQKVFAENNLQAIVYPTIGQTQVYVGESQGGSNCSISANSGLPAISLPAGFTDSGLPVGMELLGQFLHDADLLAIAHAYEVAMDTRQPPATTPALQSGLAPPTENMELVFDREGVSLRVEFEVDVSSNMLSYELTLAANNAIEVTAVTLTIDDERNDAVVVNLMGPGRSAASGSYFMSPRFRLALAQQRVYMKLFAAPFARSGATQLVQ